MLRNIGSLLTASIFMDTTVLAQKSEFEKVFNEEEDLILQDIWPRYATTRFISIQEGATEYNYPGFWQEGSFSTVTNQLGDQKLEVSLTLHNPLQTEGYIYMQWIQVVDPEKTTADTIWYESYTCSMEYKESALRIIDLNIFYPKGYKGTKKLQF